MDLPLEEQARYYRERAPEYDDWWFRRGRYASRPDHDRWFAEIAALEEALERFAPAGDILELACGTGLWTQKLAPYARRLTAIDASPEVLAINAGRVGDPRVEYLRADLFEWRPEGQYDVCFFSFWLSHVPASHFERFWQTVRAALRPSGRVFLIDSAGEPGGETTTRELDDGREFTIVKRFWLPRQLQREVEPFGFDLTVESTGDHFIYGYGVKTFT